MSREKELLAAEDAVFAAIAARDKHALALLLADDFVLRVPGQPDVDKAAFLGVIDAIPGDIVSIGGEDVRADFVGSVGRVSGLQIARVKVDGQLLEDRQSFVDLFERRADRWVMTWAFSVATPPAG
jgi:hypothetical protein